MSPVLARRLTIDRYTTMGEFATALRRTLRSANKILALLFAGLVGFLFLTGSVGTGAFALMVAPTLATLVLWRNKGIGLPLLPMMAIQHLMTYGLPIAIQHEDVFRYPPEMLLLAGVEVFAFLSALALAWWAGMEVISPSPAVAYCLQGVDREGVGGLSRLGFGLVVGSTGFLILRSLGGADFIYSILPSGSGAIVAAATATTSACGFFLVAMIVGTGSAPLWQRIAFWLTLFLNCFISASSFLLSGAAVSLWSALIGLFWSTGRLPMRFLVITLAILSFLNIGKSTMRERYWNRDDDEGTVQSFQLADIPNHYAEWALVSYETILGVPPEEPATVTLRPATTKKGQSLLERFNNLQNLLFVIDAMREGGLPALGGRTYSLIPPLLLPRILWPDKPRTHEGQVILNTHFGRQDLEGTFQTYIAWGLLPEAYGNFGAITGAILLGVAMGFFFAWLENFTSAKPLLSAEGFLAFSLFLGLANSFEMVASVMVTSIFQSILLVALACAPFVRRKPVGHRPEA